MADLAALYSIGIQLQEAGDTKAADKIAAKVDKLAASQEKAAALSAKAAAQRAAGDEASARKTERALARVEAANERAGRAIEDEAKKAQSAEKPNSSFAGVLEELQKVFQGLPGPAGETASTIGEVGAAAGPAAGAIIAVAAALTALITASIASAKGVADDVKELDRLRTLVGGNVGTLMTLLTSFKLAGAGGEDLADVLGQISQQVQEAKSGNEDLAQAFRDLGASDLDNLDSVVKQVANGVANLPASFDKASAQSKILGEQGARQFALIAGQLNEVEGLLDKYNAKISDAAQAQGREFNGALRETEVGLQGLRNAIAEQVLPGLTDAAKAGNELILALTKSETVKTIFREVGSQIGNVATVLATVVKFFVQAADVIGQADQKLKDFSGGLLSIGDIAFGPLKIIGALFDLLGGKGDRELRNQIALQEEYQESLKKQAAANQAAAEKQKLGILTVEEATKKIKTLTDANKTATQEIEQNAREVEQSIAQRLKSGAINEEKAAAERLAAAQKNNNDLLKLASDYVIQLKQIRSKTRGDTKEIDQQILDAEQALNKQRVDNSGKTIDAINQQEQGRVNAFDKANAAILESQERLLADIARRLNDGTINEREAQMERLKVARDTAKDIFANETARLAELRKIRSDNTNEVITQSAKVLAAKTALAKAERDAEIAAINDAQKAREAAFNIEQADRADRIARLERKAAEGKITEQDLSRKIAQERLDAINEEIRLKEQAIDAARRQGQDEDKINKLITDRKRLGTQQFEAENKVKDLKKQALQESLESIGKQEQAQEKAVKQFLAAAQQGLAQLAAVANATQAAISFDPFTDDIAQARKELEKIQTLLNDTRETIKTIRTGPDNILIAQEQLLVDRVTILQEKIVAAEVAAARKAAQEAFRIRVEKAKELQKELLQIEKDAEEKRAKIIADSAKRIADLKKEEFRLKLQSIFDIQNAEKQAAAERADLAKQQADRVIAEARREENERIQLAIGRARALADSEADLLERASNARIKFAEDKATLDEAIEDAKAKLADLTKQGAGADALAEAQRGLSDLEKQKESLLAQEKQRQQLEAQRAAAIAAARAAADQKRAGAKSAAELEAIDKEEQATIDSVNKKFDLEQEFQAKILKARQDGKEELAKVLQQELEIQKGIAEQRAQAEIAQAQAEFNEKQRLRDQAASDQAAQDAERLKAIDDRLAAEIAKIKEALGKQLEQVADEIKMERMARKQQLLDLENDTKATLQRLKDQYMDFFQNVDLGSQTAANAIDKIEDNIRRVIKAFQDATAAASSFVKAASGKDGGVGRVDTGGSTSNVTNGGGVSPFNITAPGGDQGSNAPPKQPDNTPANEKNPKLPKFPQLDKPQDPLKEKPLITGGTRRDIVIGGKPPRKPDNQPNEPSPNGDTPPKPTPQPVPQPVPSPTPQPGGTNGTINLPIGSLIGTLSIPITIQSGINKQQIVALIKQVVTTDLAAQLKTLLSGGAVKAQIEAIAERIAAQLILDLTRANEAATMGGF